MLSFAVEWRAQPEPRKKSPSHTFAAPTCSIFSKDMNSGKEIFFKRTAEYSRAKESLFDNWYLRHSKKPNSSCDVIFSCCLLAWFWVSPVTKKDCGKVFPGKARRKNLIEKNTENSRNIKWFYRDDVFHHKANWFFSLTLKKKWQQIYKKSNGFTRNLISRTGFSSFLLVYREK